MVDRGAWVLTGLIRLPSAVVRFVFAMIIAQLTSICTDMDYNQRIINEKLDSVSSYVRIRRFPQALARRTRRHFRHYYAAKSGVDEEEVLHTVPCS